MISDRDRANLRKLVVAVYRADADCTGIDSNHPDSWIEKVTDQLASNVEKAYVLLSTFGKL